MDPVMEYPLIVQCILNKLPRHDIRNCRLVSKMWNTEAVKLLDNYLLDVFEYLSVDDLKICRLVNKRWNKFAQILVKSKVQIGLMDVPTVQRFNQEAPQPNNFCSTVIFGKNVLLQEEEVQKFLNAFGPSIRHMELVRAKWNLQDMKNLLYNQLPNLMNLRFITGVLAANPDNHLICESDTVKILPYLENLCFDMTVLDKRNKVRVGVEKFLQDLFRICPRLKTFWCESTSIRTRTYVHDLIVNSSDLLPKLDCLSTIIDFDSKRMINLKMKSFPLKKLYLRVEGNLDIDILHSLIVTLKDTLTNLGLHFNGPTARKSECAKQFPSSKDLQKLMLLDLTGFQGSLNFLSDFPNLGIIILKEINWTKQFTHSKNEIFPSTLRFQNLKHLIIVAAEDHLNCRTLVNQFTNHGRIKYLYYTSSDELFYENTHEKTWPELQRDIFHFPFS